MLVMITGLPGTGKTTLAGALAGILHATHLNTDILRDEMGIRGQYNKAAKEAVYQELLKRTKALLQKRKSVVVDATFYLSSTRQPYIEMANEMEVPIKWIELTADESVVKERTGKKRAFSDADFHVYKKIKSEYEPLETAHLTLRSDQLQVEEMVAYILEYVKLDSQVQG